MAGVRSPGAKLLAARKMSPVERWQALDHWCRRSACVPLPTPGAPSKTSRRTSFGVAGTLGHLAVPPISHAARSPTRNWVMGMVMDEGAFFVFIETEVVLCI